MSESKSSYLTESEIARRLRVKRQTVNSWHTRGMMPAPDLVIDGRRRTTPLWRVETIARWRRNRARFRAAVLAERRQHRRETAAELVVGALARAARGDLELPPAESPEEESA